VKFKPTIAGEASGSVGALTFSHNRGGAYIRNRVIPVNPNTKEQQAIRGFVATLTSYWLNSLTALKRAAWDTYALNVPLLDSLGEPRNAGGLGMFVRSNVSRLQAAMPQQDDAPVIFNLGDYTAPVPGVASAAGQTLSLAFENGDDWANEDDSAMLVYLSRGMNASINYFKGPYRFADSVDGDSVTAPTSPQSIACPFPIAEDQKLGVKVNVTRADGRYSSPFRGTVVVAA
jgi:hypothetical protein